MEFIGFFLVLVAGFFQGTFILPMTLTKKWEWEHIWVTFSFFGMLVFNWFLAFILIPDIFAIFQAVPSEDLLILILFGAGWGIGAVLFGLGMDKLGMALGYPIIMGLIASLGALIPLLILFPEELARARGLLLILGMIITVIGIVFCSQAASKKESQASESGIKAGTLTVGLSIAIFAGILSSLPNVGMAFGSRMIAAAVTAGTSKIFAGNIVWSLFFTVGFLVNFIYCLFLMIRRRNISQLTAAGSGKNILLGVLMAIMWIGSFYLYGMSSVYMGQVGVVVGWPLFISLSIIVGNLWGLWRGEWTGAPSRAKFLLYLGIIILIAAVIIIAMSNVV